MKEEGSCQVQPERTHVTRIINCAHRGASAHAPENTLSALELALKMGATMAEVDLQQTGDDQLVLFHDDNLERTSDGNGPLWKQSLAELKRLDVGGWFGAQYLGETMPTLEELIAAVAGRLVLNLELKLHGHERQLDTLVASRLSALPTGADFFVTSFDHDLVDRVRGLLPGLPGGYIVGRGGWHDGLLLRQGGVLSLERTLATADRVEKIHEAGKQVHVWTVNEDEEMRRLQNLGVDALITNFPDRVAAWSGMD